MDMQPGQRSLSQPAAETGTRRPITRIAPSPTGRMHAGNVFAALMAWLIARREGGQVLLRIEDIDTGRARPAYTDLVLQDLEWLGLTWDGPVVYQSERTDLYLEALDLLDRRGLLYPCFCTRADLHAASAPHTVDETPVYPGTCRSLSAHQRGEAEKRHAPAWRLMVPPTGDAQGSITFHDHLQGRVDCDLGTAVGDFIVRRSDGLFAYQLAVAVDDLVQGVSLLVRGCDLLGSTPQQLYLRQLLADQGMGETVETSSYHLPLLVDTDGRRLSKRDGSCDLQTLREVFRTPEALLGHIAHMTGIVDSPDQPLSLAEILARFSLEPLKLRWAIAYR